MNMKKAYLVLLTTVYAGTIDHHIVVYAKSLCDLYETFDDELLALAYENYSKYSDNRDEDSYGYHVVKELDTESLEIWLDDCDGVLGDE
jgi:hypothetical protein